jgi:DNA-binding CsgD family transcriptional regulator/DNA-binding XRE family transcriptional regulator
MRAGDLDISVLTARERQALQYMLAGASIKEMAEAMGNQPRTVEAHRSNVLRKLGASSTTHLAAVVSGAATPGTPRPVLQSKRRAGSGGSKAPRIVPAQLRAARALLHWTLDRTAKESGVNHVTLTQFENDGKHRLRQRTETLIIRAFEQAGVEFFSDATGIGVRLKRT